MGVVKERALRVDELQLGSWRVRLAGPHDLVDAVARVLRSVSLPDDNFPPVVVTIAPDGTHATGAAAGGLQWSVLLPKEGWLSVLVGQVVATATALFQRFLFIHAGAVALDGRGCVLVGESGTGKTSTVAALVREGSCYLSDEVAVLDPITGTILPFTLPMAVKPWTRDAVGALPAADEVACEGRVRFLLPQARSPEAVRGCAVVFLKPGKGQDRLLPFSRANMLVEIARHTSSFVYPDRTEAAFAGFGRLLRNASCYVLESSVPARRIAGLIRVLRAEDTHS